VTVVCVQSNIVWEDKAANFENVCRLIAEGRPGKGSLVVLPEMFATGFSMNTDTIAEEYGGQTEQFL